ncbi:MAG: Aminoacyl-tRNA hydrolase, peptidyl-tRNA hydrolase, family [Parcubacteria group bacterium]|nr:Aminoacyl-tRNA hydrolase, peptidyl-tRNA hydrolase, family [Parcubacteria group bacterium]
MHILVGLGNPGDEYTHTRHNTGRLAVEFLEKNPAEGVKFVHLDTFMNKSGSGVAKVVKSKKAAEKLIVIYDDLDLPLGTMRVSYDRGSGGHKGIESIIKALGTTAFIRIRIGISPVTPGGKLKKPKGEKDVEKFILGEFKASETEILKKVFMRAGTAVEYLVTEGLQKAMTECNG